MASKTDRQPVEVGGLVRVVCDATDGQRVTADVVAGEVSERGCGCWNVRTMRPGTSAPREYYDMTVIFQVCGRVHDDGAGGEKLPANVVIQRTGNGTVDQSAASYIGCMAWPVKRDYAQAVWAALTGGTRMPRRPDGLSDVGAAEVRSRLRMVAASEPAERLGCGS